MTDERDRLDDLADSASDSGRSSTEDAARGVVESAVSRDKVPGEEGISEATDAAEDIASGGAAEQAVNTAIGTATSVGTGAVGSALEQSGLDPRAAAAITQAANTAVSVGRSAIRQALARRNRERERSAADESESPSSGEPVETAQGGAGSAQTGPVADTAQRSVGGSNAEQQVQAFFETDAPGATWNIARLEVTEGLNRPYEARLELRCDQMDAEPAGLLGADATVLVERGELQQRFPGLVVDVLEGADTGDYLSVHIVLTPALKLLEQGLNSRVFQNMTAPEIIEEVLEGPLAAFRREARFELECVSYPVREYCTQFDESDLDFVHRLMEEEGLLYSFDTSDSTEALIIRDTTTSATGIEANDGETVPMTSYGSQAGNDELVTRFQMRSQMLPTKLSMRHFDWTRTPRQTSPAAEPEAPMSLEAVEEGTAPEDSEPPLGSSLGPVRERYEHDTRPLTLAEYDEGAGTYMDSDLEEQTRIRRELQARDARKGSGASTANGMRPGFAFTLAGHRRAELDGRYLLTSVRHTYLVEGTESDQQYENTFECLPVDVPYRPERVTPRPRIPGIQTATVTGPSGEEIHTDAHGRVRVQFHWDRFGERNESSSCWVRVRQPWAGAGWGFVFLPRVGMEVTVTFINGDPDRPLVTGSVYNGINHPPLDLDAQKTRSTIKTRSSTDSEGYNELTFEDLTGEEQIIVHAQKDYNETVENDHATTVHGGQTNAVDGDQGETVGGDATLSVTGTRNKTITGDETNTLEAARTTTITGLEQLTCRNAREVRVSQTDLHEVTGRATKNYNGGRRTAVQQYDILSVDGGNREATVSGQYLVTSDGQLKLTQGRDSFLRLDSLVRIGTQGPFQMFNDGSMVEGEDGTLTLQSDTEIKLQCGSASLSLKTNGTIEITGSRVVASAGSNGVTVDSAGVTTSGQAVRVSGSSSVDVTGPTVKVN